MKLPQLTTLLLLASTSLTATATTLYRAHHNNVPALTPEQVSTAQTAHKSTPLATPAAATVSVNSKYRKHHNNVVSYEADASEIAREVDSLPATASGNSAPADQ